MLFGYARVSTNGQNLNMQMDALEAFGVECKNIFSDVASGVKEDRQGLDAVLMKLREGDTLIVWKSCRLARNVKHMLSMMENFQTMGVEFKSIQEPFLDTKSPHGRFIFNVFTALNQMDREINRERVIAGLAAARKRGIKGGRPRGLSDKLKKIAPAVASMYTQGKSIATIRCVFNIAQASVYRCLKHEGVEYHNVRLSTQRNKKNNNKK